MYIHCLSQLSPTYPLSVLDMNFHDTQLAKVTLLCLDKCRPHALFYTGQKKKKSGSDLRKVKIIKKRKQR